MEPGTIAALKALADPTRLRIVGRLAGGPATTAALAGELGLATATVVRQVGLLRRAGLVADGAGGLVLRIDTLQVVGRELDVLERGREDLSGLVGSESTEAATILRGYLEDGRLTTIPAGAAKRLVVLRWLRDRVFTEDRDYPEKEVNQRLALFHRDVASLRRYMVDEGLVTRSAGLYRRVP